MSWHPPAILVGNAPGLDFLNSVATPVDTPVDWIDNGEGLLSWLEQAQFVPAGVLKSIRADALPSELDKVADQARNLREWFRGFVQQHKGVPLAAKDLAQLEPLNRLLENEEACSQVIPERGGGNRPFQLQMVRRWRTPESLLLPIAEALARFVCAEDFANVKACEGHACTLFFADHTRGHARRWCSMAICGNRSKQAAHRHRTKAHRA